VAVPSVVAEPTGKAVCTVGAGVGIGVATLKVPVARMPPTLGSMPDRFRQIPAVSLRLA
jgi:hypothetical protein